MEAIGSFWGYDENIDELKNTLLQTKFELETVTKQAMANEEQVKQLMCFLKVAIQERDEATDQLQRLLNKIMPITPTDLCPVFPNIQPESLTVSDNISETYNQHSYGSSSVESLLDIVSSPDLPHINMADSSNLVLPSHASHVPHAFVQVPMAFCSTVLPAPAPQPDRGSIVIDNLVKGKPLPEKGKLLKAVERAGPLLETLLHSGFLPQWRNPPPLQSFQMPPFSLKGCPTETINLKPVISRKHPVQSSLNSSLTEISHGTPHMYSMLTSSGTCLNNGNVLPSGSIRDFSQNRFVPGKRQRRQ